MPLLTQELAPQHFDADASAVTMELEPDHIGIENLSAFCLRHTGERTGLQTQLTQTHQADLAAQSAREVYDRAGRQLAITSRGKRAEEQEGAYNQRGHAFAECRAAAQGMRDRFYEQAQGFAERFAELLDEGQPSTRVSILGRVFCITPEYLAAETPKDGGEGHTAVVFGSTDHWMAYRAGLRNRLTPREQRSVQVVMASTGDWAELLNDLDAIAHA